jgi:dTDP-4-amino-4,6-dideoxy-D-galactose acyltransferase
LGETLETTEVSARVFFDQLLSVFVFQSGDLRNAWESTGRLRGSIDEQGGQFLANLAGEFLADARFSFSQRLVGSSLASLLHGGDRLPEVLEQFFGPLRREGRRTDINLMRNFILALLDTLPQITGRDRLRTLADEATSYLSESIRKSFILAPSVISKTSVRRCLCLISYLPSFPQASHTPMVIAELAGLARSDSNLIVQLLITGESSFPGPSLWRLPQWPEELAEIDRRFARDAGDVFPQRVSVAAAPLPTDPLYFSTVEDSIRSFSPDVILCWGGVYESAVWRRGLYPFYPVMFVPFNFRNEYGAEADIVLSLLRQGPHYLFEDARIREFNAPVVDTPGTNRESVPCEGGRYNTVVVTAFNNGRLEAAFEKYDEATIDAFVGFLERNPEVTWLLVGVLNYETIPDRDPRLRLLAEAGRLRQMEFQADLSSVYAQCDVYAHLPGLAGGGVGSLMAIRAGLPVLTFFDSDVSHYVNPEDTFRNVDSFFMFLAQLCSDPPMRTRLQARQHAVVTRRHSPNECGPEMLRLLNEAAAIGKQRIRRSNRDPDLKRRRRVLRQLRTLIRPLSKNPASFSFLEWDSEFLGFPIARILPASLDRRDLQSILSQLGSEGVLLAYWFSDPDDARSVAAGHSCGGFLVDCKRTYVKDMRLVQPVSADANVGTYAQPIADSTLEALAVQSSAKSRYRVDPRIPGTTCDRLYRTWIRRSVSGEIAEKVLVFREADATVGMVTLSVNAAQGSIGLIAVDSGYRREGAGQALLAAADSYFQERGCIWARVVTQTDNLAACGLFEWSGYVLDKSENVFHFWLA